MNLRGMGFCLISSHRCITAEERRVVFFSYAHPSIYICLYVCIYRQSQPKHSHQAWRREHDTAAVVFVPSSSVFVAFNNCWECCVALSSGDLLEH